MVCSSPHSGRFYPKAFRRMSRLDEHSLRRSEDSHVDALFAAAPKVGASLLAARYPRAYVDLNRAANELDPLLFEAPLPMDAQADSERVAAGLGVIARVVASGVPIYSRRLPLEEAERRIAAIYHPYHAALANLLTAARRRWGWSLLLDCHSMPSRIGGDFRGAADGPAAGVDIVLGDCHGTSCAPDLVAAAESTLREMGYRVQRNRPYAGGYCTQHYGRPATGVHALQIEINRALYMDESTLGRRAGFSRIAADMTRLLAALVRHDLDTGQAIAAE